MRVSHVMIIGLMFILLLWWKPLEASACSCIMPPPPEDALDQADAVFSGEVVEVIENGKLVGGYGKTVHFKVDEVWKGIDESEAVITTGLHDGDCGIPFVKGQKYLVYASKSDMYVKNTLSTTICHRTTELAYATEDLNALGEGQEVSSSEEVIDEDEAVIPWLTFVIFVVGLIAIFIAFRYKKTRS
ncbi:hypothetical protein [Sporosarcina sp. UB5]|uniref:hypothetical protein n=1 Tax=Sporosarcina sp. UB5 TaxID=3047463 RepID=UPI003D7B79C0